MKRPPKTPKAGKAGVVAPCPKCRSSKLMFEGDGFGQTCHLVCQGCQTQGPSVRVRKHGSRILYPSTRLAAGQAWNSFCRTSTPDIVYVVDAFRYGFSNRNHYRVGATANINTALTLAHQENCDRGGKYSLVVTRFESGRPAEVIAFFPSQLRESSLSIDVEEYAWKELLGRTIFLALVSGKIAGQPIHPQLSDEWRHAVRLAKKIIKSRKP